MTTGVLHSRSSILVVSAFLSSPQRNSRSEVLYPKQGFDDSFYEPTIALQIIRKHLFTALSYIIYCIL